MRTWPPTGSSPLARGLRARRRISPGTSRIIPARAGFTLPARPPGLGVEDHPRSRGVYASLDAGDPLAVGSSPLARGLRRVAEHSRNPVGIIPARAGFTPGSRSPRTTLWDHPRSRGVYGGSLNTPGTLLGSSPLARGLRRGQGHRGQPCGIIPARAGFTLTRSSLPQATGDHPRSRGVYPMTAFIGTRIRGSSPLARGLQAYLLCGREACGIIPARAGFT